MWWPPRMATSLSFVYKYGFIWGDPEASFARVCGDKIGCFSVAGLFKRVSESTAERHRHPRRTPLAASRGPLRSPRSPGHPRPPYPCPLLAERFVSCESALQTEWTRSSPSRVLLLRPCLTPILMQRTWMAFHPCDREEGSVPLLLGLVCYPCFEFWVFRYIPC